MHCRFILEIKMNRQSPVVNRFRLQLIISVKAENHPLFLPYRVHERRIVFSPSPYVKARSP